MPLEYIHDFPQESYQATAISHNRAQTGEPTVAL